VTRATRTLPLFKHDLEGKTYRGNIRKTLELLLALVVQGHPAGREERAEPNSPDSRNTIRQAASPEAGSLAITNFLFDENRRIDKPINSGREIMTN